MTVDKAAHSQSGWVVRVTAPEQMGRGASEPEIWDVAMSDPDEAVKRVCEHIRVSGERAEAADRTAPCARVIVHTRRLAPSEPTSRTQVAA